MRSWCGNKTQTHEGLIAIIQMCYFPFLIYGLTLLNRRCTKERNLFYAILTIPLYFWVMTVLTAFQSFVTKCQLRACWQFPSLRLERILFRVPAGTEVKESVLVSP